MFFFGKRNTESRRFSLYKPEPANTDIHSKWRKPSRDYLESARARKQQLTILQILIKSSAILNVILALCVFIGLIVLLFFTDFERVVFDDGTYLSCIIEPNGTIVTKY